MPLSLRETETDWRNESLTFVFGSQTASRLDLKKQSVFRKKKQKTKTYKLHLEAHDKLTKTKPHERSIDLVLCKSTFTTIPTL